MTNSANHWALLLAAGAGTRLSHLTTAQDGASVPKQFCSLSGGASLLEETLERAFGVVAPERTVVVVAAEQQRFWVDQLDAIPAENVIVQPQNRGTANGLLLGIAAIRVRDPAARLVVLPSDHYVEQEDVLCDALRGALRMADADPRTIAFLGVQPDAVDTELGYIVRGLPEARGAYRIAEFVEKPSHELAQELLGRSALWNSFILAGSATAFLDLIGQRFPVERHAVESLLARMAQGRAPARELESLYRQLRSIDFSRDVVEGAERPLSVVPVAACGWSDLGTPKRVAAALGRLGARQRVATSRHLNLAEACTRLLGHDAVAARQWA